MRHVISVRGFWEYSALRMQLWAAENGRDIDMPNDRIMRRYRFPNVYRELDDDAVWLQPRLDGLSLREGLWLTCILRFIDWIPTFNRHGVPTPANYKEWLKEVHRDYGRKLQVFTNMHQTPGIHKTRDMLDFLTQWGTEIVSELKGTMTPKEVFTTLKQIPHVSTFFGWQITCDLREARLVFPYDENEWIKVGPGPRSVIEKITDRRMSEQDCLGWIRILRQTQNKYKAQTETPWIDLPQFDEVNLKNLEHCLCGYAGYTLKHENS